MCLLRALRPDRVLFSASTFVGTNIGAAFADPPPFDLGQVYDTSTNKRPLIFILSPGVDPTAAVLALANAQGIELGNVAMGQGDRWQAADHASYVGFR